MSPIFEFAYTGTSKQSYVLYPLPHRPHYIVENEAYLPSDM